MKFAAKIILFLVLLLICLALASIALNPDWRKQAQDAVFQKERVVLSTASGRFSEESGKLKIVKSKDKRGVFVEVFEELEGQPPQMIATILTGNPYDGQFNFRGHMSRLVAADIDKDGFDEILVPTFDSAMRPLLKVYKYRSVTKDFQEVTPDF